MRLRGQLFQTFLVQGVGAASALLAVLILGSVFGPESQGLFSRIKIEVEFCAALAMLGMPQALFYFVKTSRLDLRVALRWASLSPLVGTVVAFGYAVACCTWLGILRGLTLVQPTILQFNITTSLPQFFMLLLAMALVLWHENVAQETLVAGFTTLFAISTVAALRPLLRLTRSSLPPSNPARIPAVLRYGTSTWLTVSLIAAGTMLIQRGVESVLGSTALGLFTMALTLAQVPLTPLNYALPVLFRHWVQQGNDGLPWRALSLCLGGLLLAATIAASLSSVQPNLWLGTRYNGLASLLSVLLVGAAGETLVKVIVVDCYARSALWPPILAEVIRCTVVIAWWMLSPWSHPIVVGVTWTIAAWCAAIFLCASRCVKARTSVNPFTKACNAK
jgi:O-antigen/teichoic acid export membrane protein